MDSKERAERLQVAVRIAREAGEMLRPAWGKAQRFRTKSTAVDLVTEYDEKSETLIVSELKRAFPGDHIVGEEGARVEGSAGAPTWYIDPIDGTANFAHGVPMFSVSLGLAESDTGRPLLGVVHAPAMGHTFSGAPGLGAHNNDEPISVSGVEELEASMLATGFPQHPDLPHDNLPEWSALTGKVHGTRRVGSAALDLAFVACGWFDGFWERHIKAWDTMGGAAVVQAAGGRVTDLNGDTFQGVSGRVLATNGRIHEALSAVLGRVAAEAGVPWP